MEPPTSMASTTSNRSPARAPVIVSYVGYQPQRQEGVVINSNKIAFLDIQLTSGIELTEFEVVQYTVPLIDKDGGASGGTVTREDIARCQAVRPHRSPPPWAERATPVREVASVSVEHARNTYYYIDGVKCPPVLARACPRAPSRRSR